MLAPDHLAQRSGAVRVKAALQRAQALHGVGLHRCRQALEALLAQIGQLEYLAEQLAA